MLEWLFMKQQSLLEQLDSSAASFLRCQSIVRDSGLILLGKKFFDLRVDAHCFDHFERCKLWMITSAVFETAAHNVSGTTQSGRAD